MSNAATVADRNLPGLSIAFNRDAFIELLSENLPECRDVVRLSDARIIDVQYTPDCSAQVLWKLSFQDSETGRTGRQLVFAKVLRKDDPAPAEPVELVRRYGELRARKHMARQMPVRTPWLCIPRADMLVHAFPLDPALPTLIDIADPAAVKESLQQIWQPRNVRVRSVRVETLGYTPEQRAALKYEVLSEDRDTGLPELRHLVGKLHARRSPARLFAGHWAVWRRARGRVSIAPPAGYVAVQRLSLQDFVSGVRLSDLVGPGSFVGQIRTAARSIANVHRLTLPLLTERGLEKEMAVVRRWIAVLSRLRPAYAARLERIGGRLQRELAERMHVCGTVHADFHLANMLADDYGVTLIDWDQIAHGDPMIDVGRTLASLRVSSLRVHGTLNGFAEAEEAFLRAYLDQTKDDECRARLFEAVALLVAAAAPFRLQREGWEGGAELMLDEVERTLQLSLNGVRVAFRSSGQKGQVAYAERLDWALNQPYSQALLAPVVHNAFGSDIEITETKPCLLERSADLLRVRWDLKGYKGKHPWTTTLDGLSLVDDSGRGPLRRLTAANETLDLHPEALQLPRALGHLEPISMLVFMVPKGRPVTDLLGSREEKAAIGQLSCALVNLHSLKIDLGKERETMRDVRSVGRRVARLAAAGHPAAGVAQDVFDQLEPLIAKFGERRAPSVKGLRLRELRFDETGTRTALLQDIVLSEPLLTAGDLYAQLLSYALDHSIPHSAATLFHETYLESSDEPERPLLQFEALALLQRACRRGVQDVQNPLVARLIEAARQRCD